ncbi:hypothetical protein LG277_04110 [Vreelandella aquamarina]|uniref:PA3496 family putative envelope integrity protein n=1 Tax=Vreelandella aquamarina TaxID=77097 RepID=UPI00384CA2BF
MRRDPIDRSTHYYCPSEHPSAFPDNDDLDSQDAVNDDQYGRSRSSKRDTLTARRRVEALLEERRLRKALDDDWYSDD